MQSDNSAKAKLVCIGFLCGTLAFTPLVRGQTDSSEPLPQTRATPPSFHIIEPPSPNLETPWTQVRSEQLSFVERLKEWGIAVEIERKDQLEIENSPDLFTFSTAWQTPTKFELSVGIRTPDNQFNERASFKYKGEFSETGTESSTSGQIEFANGEKFAGAVKSDERHGLGYELGFEIERGFAALKGKFDSTESKSVSYETEIDLTKLYQLSHGVAGGSEEAGSVKLKVDLEKYFKRFVEFAPHLTDFASRPGREAANAVTIQGNPILLGAAIADDVSAWARQKAVSQVNQELRDELPKGVQIHFNNNLLGEMLQKSSHAEGRGGLNRLADAMEKVRDSAARAKLLRGYIDKLKASYTEGRKKRVSKAITLVSLNALVAAAEPFAKNWANLPAELRSPGGIARIVGYQLDQVHDDVMLIGELIPGAPVLTIDDLIVGVRTVWKENATPFVSLDPDPSNMSAELYVRVGGVPDDSGFAQVMLDADYLMKRIGVDLVPVESPGYRTLKDIWREEIEQGSDIESHSRFWLYPSPLQRGDIELSPDGTLVLFNTGVQVLSEQMVLSHSGMLLGTGKVNKTHDRWAAGLTKSFPDLELKLPEFHHLHGLFDLVLLAKTWQRLKVNSSCIVRLAALPYQRFKLPSSYKGFDVTLIHDLPLYDYHLSGGVEVRTAASPRAWLVADQQELVNVREAAEGSVDVIVRPLIGRLSLPAGTRRQANTMKVAQVLALLRTGDITLAISEVEKLIKDDPFDPEPWCLRALINLKRRSYEAVLADAGHALDLDPENPETVQLAFTLRFQAHYLTGNTDEALSDIEMMGELLSDSPHAYILGGNALAALERIPEARAAYRKALRLDAGSVLANVGLGLLEISEGWVVRGKKLIENAQLQMKAKSDIPTLKAALAIAEIGMAILGNTEAHYSASRKYAVEVLASPSSDPLSCLRALSVQAILALIGDDLSGAEQFVQEAMNLAPHDPTPLLLMVNWTHELKQDEVAHRYLARAEEIATDFPAVKKFRQILGGPP